MDELLVEWLGLGWDTIGVEKEESRGETFFYTYNEGKSDFSNLKCHESLRHIRLSVYGLCISGMIEQLHE